MASQDPEIRARVIGNMNAGRREQHRNRIDPQRALDPEVLERLVDDAERDRLASIAARGGAAYAEQRAALRQFQADREALIAEVEGLLERIRKIGAAA